MRNKKEAYPQKRSLNLYYKVDKTTKPATMSLYVLLVIVIILGVAKLTVYDLYKNVQQARESTKLLEERLNEYSIRLSDYDYVLEQYSIYSSTEEENNLIDRMDILTLLDNTIDGSANISNISISENNVVVQFSGVDLAKTAEFVQKIEMSPIVKSTSISAARTMDNNSSTVSTGILIELEKEGEASENTANSP